MGEGGGTSLVQPPVGSNLTLFLIQVVVILVIVRLLGKLLAKIKQPMVIGNPYLFDFTNVRR